MGRHKAEPAVQHRFRLHRKVRRYQLAAVAAVAVLISTVLAFQVSPGPATVRISTSSYDGDGGVLQSLTAVNDCTLWVPWNPLSPHGLATPYRLASGNDGTTCSETNEGTAAFVQATIVEPGGRVVVYNPVVRDAGQPLQGTAPPVPHLPFGSVVTITTGFNGNVLKLVGPGARQFVNFAQQSYAYSPLFFRVMRFYGVHAPPLGTAKDGKTCPSTRDFTVVDQDQSDNNVEAYPAYGVSNGSDEALLAGYIDPAIGCTAWTVPVISGGGMSTSEPLQEYQAAADQQAPVALVPGLDDFVTSGGQGPLNGGVPNLYLDNLYRAQVDQPPTWNDHDTLAYCQNMANAVPRLKALAAYETGSPPPFAQLAPTLAGTIQVRFQASWSLLTCQALGAGPDPYP